MDRDTAKEFRKDFKTAMASLEEKYNARITLGSISFSSNSLRSKFEFVEHPENGKTIEEVEFAKVAPRYGLTGEDYGRLFVSNGETYILTGLNPRAPKYPIIGTMLRNASKRYKFTRKVLDNLGDFQWEV